MPDTRKEIPRGIVWVSVLTAVVFGVTSLAIAGCALFLAMSLDTAQFNEVIASFLMAATFTTLGLLGVLGPSTLARIVKTAAGIFKNRN